MPRGQSQSPAVEGTRTPYLAVELCERIIGFLDESSAGTIASCALVCHAWLPFSRYALYDNVHLQNSRQWTCFLRVLLHPSSSVAPYFQTVQRLHVELTEGYFDAQDWGLIGWGEKQRKPWAHLVLIHGARRLPGLTNLHFQNINWGERWFRTNLLYVCNKAYHSLTTLKLWKCRFVTTHQLQQLILGFPTLSELSLSIVTFRRRRSPHSLLTGPRRTRNGPRLTSLDLNCNAMVEVCRRLVEINSLQTLAKLRWWPIDPSKVEIHTELQELLNTIDGSCDDLSLILSGSARVDLSSHDNLQRLHLSIELVSSTEGLDSLKHALFGLSTHSLERLDVFCRFSSTAPPLRHTLAHIDIFNDIDIILSRPQFDGLEHFGLSFLLWVSLADYYRYNTQSASDSTCPTDVEVWAKELVLSKTQEMLANISSRGILHLDVAAKFAHLEFARDASSEDPEESDKEETPTPSGDADLDTDAESIS